MKSFFVYILKCSDGSYYIGHTDNIDQRIADHHSKLIDGYTASRLPAHIVFLQDFQTRDEAFNAERQIKGWSRKKKEALIKEDWKEVSRLAIGYKKKK